MQKGLADVSEKELGEIYGLFREFCCKRVDDRYNEKNERPREFCAARKIEGFQLMNQSSSRARFLSMLALSLILFVGCEGRGKSIGSVEDQSIGKGLKSLQDSSLRPDCEFEYSEIGQEFGPHLENLVEGLGKILTIRIVNKTKLPIRDITANVSCGCLRVSVLDRVDVPPSSDFHLRFAMIPTVGRFSQKCIVSGISGNGVRGELFSVLFVGSVDPPIVAALTSLSTLAFPEGAATIGVVSVDGALIDYSRISSNSELYSATGDKANSQIRIQSMGITPKEEAFTILIPFAWSGRSFTHSLPFEVVDQILQITPTKVFLRRSDAGYRGRVLLRAAGASVSHKNCNITATTAEGKALSNGVTVAFRPVSIGKSLCDIFISQGVSAEIESFRIVVTEGSHEHTHVVPCVLQEF